MERSPSSTSNSRAVLRDLLVGGLALVGLEWYLSLSMRAVEFPARSSVSRPAAPAPPNYFHLGRSNAADFFNGLSSRRLGPVIVCLGDSQGLGPLGGGGDSYPRILARISSRGRLPRAVISLHLIGANAYEQGVLLLSLFRAGIQPQVVVWAHSLFSHRKNEIRSDLVAAYRALGDEIDRYAPRVILLGDQVAPGGLADRANRRWTDRVSDAWSRFLNRSATIRFSRQPLGDKFLILRHGPLVNRIPAKWLPGKARTYNPPTSLLKASAKFVGELSAAMEARGIRVIDFLEPVDRDISPRPFSAQAEDSFYAALQDAVLDSGAEFLNLLDALTPERFGDRDKESPDPYHIDIQGHEQVAARLAAILELH